MTGQLSIFQSSERGKPNSGAPPAVETRQTPTVAAVASLSRSGDTCPCGSTENVMYGQCRACFDAWEAAA